MTYKIGEILTGTVTGVQTYGAFVSLDAHTQGLIHISEIQSGFTKNIRDVVQIGEKLQVQIIDIDEYTQKISLSRRTLEKQFVRPPYHRKHYFTDKNKQIGFQTIDEHLPGWIDEAMDILSS
ncbi:CvfD/Ygs/GSP13 family RNA-binding post-transcriptional regulator [Tetragenococcus koreensis]|uniref:RNA-binding protein n=1 Tax=Tetragenococcus koreensis TaxID=290335 RepID=A0AAN4UDD3_9ENTE|nr:CvfD/Ygs/GSP13 family RNA-binding post-transcriptional regulator [Tetragenococcus koreensis]AYW46696.1 RNA-binding protein [Tetragenococcus koreensis]MCF1585851.1 CvfD/Ygs/GSP13 family RNA-binding post-transcriptional regulator [Tetragenococcus koreensis]MCF1615421.1 CvfD/Ygs/GSP13 family RNA-binding post-transcriptional regulator [Tetragenococcus koreensis]MCF1618250.1 CvfD/Ygs/GSP13 family RNA-binding post-transcriptional regulator [Tetragenococcus koreensis]MCF1619188.1 CvfD/Ygs/GSP13 fa